jgi:predicted TIM-barrel fold metal-dependent hydrolase
VIEAIERAQEVLARYDAEVARELPAGAEIFDVHVHLGTDIDGMTGDFAQLVEIQERYGISGAFMFCLDEPDREPAFRAANDRTLAYAERSGGRFVPFVRLDLTQEPIEEARRCLDLGARGIKLHPRAQRFEVGDKLVPVFEIAAERRVPILIHGGRGLPPIADGLAALHEAFPEAPLIIAHAGIADMAALAGKLGGRAGVYFDTSVWSPIDLLDLHRQVGPEQVLYASDYPYGQQPGSLLIAIRTARAAGLSDDDVRAMLSGNARRIIAGEPPLEPSTPRGSGVLSQPVTFARIHQYLSMATPLLWTRQPDTVGVIGLALNACYERDGHPEESERIAELVEAAGALWKAAPEIQDERERWQATRLVFRLVHLADIWAVTTSA